MKLKGPEEVFGLIIIKLVLKIRINFWNKCQVRLWWCGHFKEEDSW